MSAKLQIVDLGDGITTVREDWLGELRKSEKEEGEKERKAQEYARQLAERTREIAILREHARKLGVHAMRLQRAQEQAQRQAKEAGRELEAEFEALAQQWLKETRFLSDPVKKFMHPSHLKIIAMGEKILPLVLREVQKMSGHWFIVLEAISPENPIKPEDETSLQRVANAWLVWGRGRGLI